MRVGSVGIVSGDVIAEDAQVVKASPLVSVSRPEDRYLDPEISADRTAAAAPGAIGEGPAVAFAKTFNATGYRQMLYGGAELCRDCVLQDGIQRILDAALISVECP